MITTLWKGIVWVYLTAKWLIIIVGTIVLGLIYELKARAERVADISLVHCVNMIQKDSDLTLWEQQLKAEKADIIERERDLKARGK